MSTEFIVSTAIQIALFLAAAFITWRYADLGKKFTDLTGVVTAMRSVVDDVKGTVTRIERFHSKLTISATEHDQNVTNFVLQQLHDFMGPLAEKPQLEKALANVAAVTSSIYRSTFLSSGTNQSLVEQGKRGERPLSRAKSKTSKKRKPRAAV